MLDALRGGDARVRWSACVQDVATGRVLAEHDADVVGPTASVGKLLLLLAVAQAAERGALSLDEPLGRGGEAVADSGLWQHLRVPALPVADLALLVGAVSDNAATNVLLDRVGLPAVQQVTDGLGLPVHLHDRVRDVRGPEHPPTLSSASARGLAELLARLARDEVPGGAQVLRWLSASHDLSMVAARWGLDPLSHAGAVLRHKTGTDEGVRADTGLVRGERDLAYAVVARWEGDVDVPRVLGAMAAVGERLLSAARAPAAPRP